jgi:hypothetical protein
MTLSARFPAKAGTHFWAMLYGEQTETWTPAFAGERNSW